METEVPISRKGETTASDSQPAEVKMGQQMALVVVVHQGLPLLGNGSGHIDVDDDSNPVDDDDDGGNKYAFSADSLKDLVGWKKALEPMRMDVAVRRKHIDDFIDLLSACDIKLMRDLEPKFSILKDALKEIAEKIEEMAEAKLEHARAIKQIRDLNLKLSILNDVLKEMVEAGEKKEQDV